MESSRSCAARRVASQRYTAPLCSAWPVSTGLAGTQTKNSASRSVANRRISVSRSSAPTVSLATISTRCGAAAAKRSAADGSAGTFRLRRATTR